MPHGKGASPPLAVCMPRPQRQHLKGHGQLGGDQVPRRGRPPGGQAAGPGSRAATRVSHVHANLPWASWTSGKATSRRRPPPCHPQRPPPWFRSDRGEDLPAPPEASARCPSTRLRPRRARGLVPGRRREERVCITLALTSSVLRPATLPQATPTKKPVSSPACRCLSHLRLDGFPWPGHLCGRQLTARFCGPPRPLNGGET